MKSRRTRLEKLTVALLGAPEKVSDENLNVSVHMQQFSHQPAILKWKEPPLALLRESVLQNSMHDMVVIDFLNGILCRISYKSQARK